MSALAIVFATVLLGVVAAVLREVILRPHLRLVYDGQEECRFLTEGHYLAGGSVDVIFVRVRVSSRSPTHRVAKGCVPYLASLEKKGTDGKQQLKFNDNLVLAWSYRDKEAPESLDISDGVPRLFAVLHTRQDANQFEWCFRSLMPHSYEDLRIEQDDFVLTIVVTAENAPAAWIQLLFKWRGRWDDFEVETLGTKPSKARWDPGQSVRRLLTTTSDRWRNVCNRLKRLP